LSKLFTLILLLCSFFVAKAQSSPFGKVDTADLKLTSCDFEKGANAMVLFDRSDITTGFTSTSIIRHKRIKIFNDKGKDEATIKLDYYSYHGLEKISDVKAETINLNGKTIEYITVDKAGIYNQTIDKALKRMSFTFPQVKAGSIIEYSYEITIGFGGGFPDWDFQGDLPVRYCELNANIRSDYSYKMTPRVYQDYARNIAEVWTKKNGDTIGKSYSWALDKIKSFREEPYSTCVEDDIQKLSFRLVGYKYTLRSEIRSLEKSWFQIGEEAAYDEDFGKQMAENIDDESDIIKQVKLLRSDNEKISYIFDKVKSSMQWDNVNRWYTIDGIKKAWSSKKGNSTEINLILYHFLRAAGISCFPELVSTRAHGRINTNYPDLNQFNKAVIYVPLGNKKYYILDASNRYNNYTDIPFDILNSNGLTIDPKKGEYTISYIKNDEPSRTMVFVNAVIDSGMSGTAQINSFGYNKESAVEEYKVYGENKYKENLKDKDNNLQISSFKLENMEIDSLPLTQTVNFKLDLTSSDEKYIYFSPNLFTGLNANPFLNEERYSSINFKFLRNYNINGRYKIPQGYKTDALPKSMSLLMPDSSIFFKRIVAEQEGLIIVHYVIDFKKSYYTADEYKPLFEFYRKMHEMLNEQIVLKKI